MARTETMKGRSGAWSAGYWVAAVLLYAMVGTRLPQAVFLGFWQSIPYLLVAHWFHGRLFGRPGV